MEHRPRQLARSHRLPSERPHPLHVSHHQGRRFGCLPHRPLFTLPDWKRERRSTRRYAEARVHFAAGVTLLGPAPPMFFMGEEVGAWQPYRYNDFIDFREDYPALRADAGAQLFRFYQDLIRLRLARPALRSHALDILHVHDANRVLAFRRWEGEQNILVMASLNNHDFAAGYRIQHPAITDGHWREIFNSDARDLDKKADYVLALKGNQGTLREDVELFAAEQKANGFKDAKISRHQTVDGDHGRIETRTYTAIHDVAWLQERHGWPGLQGVIMVESTREIADKIERETRFYITSLVWLASQLGPVTRSHWAIGVSSEGHAVMSVKVRPEPKNLGSEAREALWRESKTAEPSDNILERHCCPAILPGA